MHTPGPWHGSLNIVGADSTVVCTINRPLGGSVRTEKENARLIAAAPELLWALQDMLDISPYHTDEDGCECGDGGTQDCEHMRAFRAIAKATGEKP